MKKDSFKDFVLDQMYELGPVNCRSMFGGFGLYWKGIFFGMIHKGRLYFKTHSSTLSDYLDRGMQPFRPNAKQTLKTYYEVPSDILEDPDQLKVWVEKALQSNSSEGDFPEITLFIGMLLNETLLRVFV